MVSVDAGGGSWQRYQYAAKMITDDNAYCNIIIIVIVMTVINGSSAALSTRIFLFFVSLNLSSFSFHSTQTHKSLYNRVLCVCVGLCLRRRRRCKAPNDLGPRATGGGNLSCGLAGTWGRTSWRIGGFYAYTYTFFYLLAFRNLFYICFT